MQTSKQYLQMWYAYKHKHGPLTMEKIWNFQKSILSCAEAEQANNCNLKLEPCDPRNQVMDITDKAFDKAFEQGT